MKTLVIILITLLSRLACAQDTTFIKNGYILDYPHLYIRIDTVQAVVQARSYYRRKHLCNIRQNGYMYFKMDLHSTFGKRFTFPFVPGSVIIITRKKFRREYKI